MTDSEKCIYDLVKIVSEQNSFIKNLNKEIDKLQKSNATYKKNLEDQYVTIVQNNYVISEEKRKYDEFMYFLRTNFAAYFPDEPGQSTVDHIDDAEPSDTVEKSNIFI